MTISVITSSLLVNFHKHARHRFVRSVAVAVWKVSNVCSLGWSQLGRWTASKGSAINMQNLKRGSFLRKAIMAPEGYQLVVGDLSQIEPRVLAWLSDYTDMLSIFSAGGVPYAAFGSQMFNIPGMTKESHPVHR